MVGRHRYMIGRIEVVDDVIDDRPVQMLQVLVDLPLGDLRAVSGREIGGVRAAQQFLLRIFHVRPEKGQFLERLYRGVIGRLVRLTKGFVFRRDTDVRLYSDCFKLIQQVHHL